MARCTGVATFTLVHCMRYQWVQDCGVLRSVRRTYVQLLACLSLAAAGSDGCDTLEVRRAPHPHAVDSFPP
eukprot:687720-Prymnesium_polylepis.2